MIDHPGIKFYFFQNLKVVGFAPDIALEKSDTILTPKPPVCPV